MLITERGNMINGLEQINGYAGFWHRRAEAFGLKTADYIQFLGCSKKRKRMKCAMMLFKNAYRAARLQFKQNKIDTWGFNDISDFEKSAEAIKCYEMRLK